MESTLLLSCGYEPLTIISWQRAISMLTLNKVEVVESYNRDIRSVSLVLKMPAVVRLVSLFGKKRKHVKFNRQNVLARDGWKCQYCGFKKSIAELTYDHVIPKSQGGTTCWENIVSCCRKCNNYKSNRTPQQAGMRLIKPPIRPRWVPFLAISFGKKSVPDQWASYLYWNTELDSA